MKFGADITVVPPPSLFDDVETEEERDDRVRLEEAERKFVELFGFKSKVPPELRAVH